MVKDWLVVPHEGCLSCSCHLALPLCSLSSKSGPLNSTAYSGCPQGSGTVTGSLLILLVLLNLTTSNGVLKGLILGQDLFRSVRESEEGRDSRK